MYSVDMSCTLCTVRERRTEPTTYLFPSTPDMGMLLTEVLEQHGVSFEPRANLIALSDLRDPSRVVALLRQILSEPERQDLTMFQSDGREFPRPRSLDDWWHVHHTGWFASALSGDRFTTWFQPIVDTNGRLPVGHECLIRLETDRTYTGSEILAAARLHKEIHAFDSYARCRAIRSAARQSPSSLYFVNFLPSAIYNPQSCLQATMNTLADCNLSPANIVFETVESDPGSGPEHLRRICDYFHGEGFGFALDNVGVGPHWLQTICDLRPDYIKLDCHLARNVEQPVYAATIRRLVELAEQLDIVLITTGVEKAQTMENLWLLGVEYMQGYLFGRPAPRLFNPRGAGSRPAAEESTTYSCVV
jgi:EAL domain-containing protein (putative c-di-GMP-specific phosphodiesterase class I)